ncbi:hypothetical protein Tco_0965338 [Tanacetum coccineum]
MYLITWSYKVVKIRYPFPRSSQNRRDLPRDNPLVSVEVLRYDIKKSKSKNKGIVLTEIELVLEQIQQGISHEVSSDTKVITMTMEILSEPTSNKLCDAPVMRTASTAVKPCQEDFLEFYLITGTIYTDQLRNMIATEEARRGRTSATLISSFLKRRSVKVKELQERCIIKAFKLKNQEKYEHVSSKVTSTQDGKTPQEDDKRLCLVDDLKRLKFT